MENSAFLPPDYEAPAMGGNYAKISLGENRFRICSKPILGWVGWKDKKPYRFPYNKKPDTQFDQPLKHFWAFVVWDYSDNSLKILEVSQATVQSGITDLARSEDWGAPYEYDIKITKSGTDKNTKYSVQPTPKKEVSEEVYKATLDKPIWLDALFMKDGDPFKADNPHTTAIELSDLPF